MHSLDFSTMYSFLIQTNHDYGFLVYLIIIIIAIVEGPVLSVMLGAILKLGYFDFVYVYAAVMLGDLLGDTFWYYLGISYGEKAVLYIKEKFGLTDSQITNTKNKILKHRYKMLFFSKISNGLGMGFLIMVLSGVVRVRYLYFMIVNFLGQIIWSGMLILLGYSFYGIYERIDVYIGKVLYIMLVVVAILVYLAYIFIKDNPKRRRYF